MNPKVIQAEAIDHQHLRLTFSNGEQKRFDIRPYLNIGVFRALTDPQLFQRAKVVAGSVEWPGEIDLSYDTLYIESTS